MRKLTEVQQRYIVQRLAYYDSPSQIVLGVKEEFGVACTRQQVLHYSPEHGKPAEKWIAIHKLAREAFEKDVAAEPAAKRVVRVRRLARMAERAEANRNFVVAASLYEQIAKEEGRWFENYRAKEPSALSDDERIERIKESMREMERRTVGHSMHPPTLSIVEGDAA